VKVTHHNLIAVAVFVQHTTDVSYKATSKYKITTSNIATTIKLFFITPHCSRNKMLTAANPGAYYIKHVLEGIEEKNF